MEELLLEMMNRGYLVYKTSNKTWLQKVNTPASPCNIQFDNSKTYIECESVERALALAKQKMEWEDENLTDKPAQIATRLWELELILKHRGFVRPRFVPLGQFQYNVLYSEALIPAKEVGRDYIEQEFKKDEIESWEIKIRPAKVCEEKRDHQINH